MKTRKWLLPTLTASVALVLFARYMPGQILGASKAAPTDSIATGDTLGRDTPRGTVLGFLRAIRIDKPETAISYLQLPPGISKTQAIRLAEELGTILDQGLNTSGVSNKPEGKVEEGEPASKDRSSPIHLRNGDVYDLIMIRVSDPSGKKIWLISRETIALVPEMYSQVGFPEIEEKLPEFFVQFNPGGVPLWKWILSLLLIPVALLIAWLITQLMSLGHTFIRRQHGHKDTYRPWRVVLVPVLIIIGLIVHLGMVRRLGMPALYRYYYSHFVSIAIAFSAAWIVWRLIDRATEASRLLISRRGYLSANSFVMLMQRMLKAIVLFGCFLALLNIFGVDTKAAVAGLGIGGIAIALAAQKTLENLLGGVSVIFDQVLRVGDSCKLGERIGTVEDISLRSTRLRTLEGSVLSIPNGGLATINIENLTERRKILFNPTFNLRYETTPDQLRKVLAEIRALLYSHPQIEQGNCRVRLGALGTYSIDIDVFSYVLGGDFAAFAAIREDLLLRIFDTVRDSGTDFAFPTQTLHLARDTGFDEGKKAAAEQLVAEWRQRREVPFPDYAPDHVDRLRGSLEWPPADSAISSRKP
jgi:MscS family membrane protein